MKNKIFFVLIVVMYWGCQKDGVVEPDIVHNYENESPEHGNVDRSNAPDNPNNYQEHYGYAFHSALKSLNTIQEGSNAATNSIEYISQFDSIIHTYGLRSLCDTTSFTYVEKGFVESILSVYQESVDYRFFITDVTTIENQIGTSVQLYAAQKDRLLALTSILKYMEYTHVEYGLIVNGYDGSDLPFLADWSDCLNGYIGDCLVDSLTDWEEGPVSTFFAWAGLPLTVVGCHGDGLWNAINNC